MAKTVNYKRTGDWKKLLRALDGNTVHPIIEKHLKNASKLNGKVAERFIRQEIKTSNFSGEGKTNALLTTQIKKSTKPLVDAGAQLYASITSVQDAKGTVFAGVLKVNPFYNLARAIHDGVTIDVTDKMRNLFLVLFYASFQLFGYSGDKLTGRAKELWDRKPGGWFPIKKDKINIPERPFIMNAFRRSKLRDIAIKNWSLALNKAFKELAR